MFASMFAGLAMLAAAGFQPPQPAPATVAGPVPTTLELMSPSRFGEVRVSPSGRYIALVRRQGVRSVVVVIDRTAKAQTLAFDKTDMAWLSISEVIWKGDDRLVVFWRGFSVKKTKDGAAKTKTVEGESLGVVDKFDRGVSSVARTGGPLTDLGEGYLSGRLPGDPQHILIALQNRANTSLFSVDVTTGERTLLEKGTSATMSWVADATGKPAVRYDIYGRRGGLQVMGRDANGKWVPTFAIRPKDIEAMEDIALLSPTGEPGKFYVAVKPEGTSGVRTRELRIYDFITRTMGEKIWSHPKYDFDSILLRDQGQRLAAVCYWAEIYTCDYLDPAEKREMQALQTFFTDERSMEVEDQSTDASVQVLTVTGAEEPRSYYIYDRKTQRADLLGSGHPALRPDRLAIARPYAWKASDGLELSGYLTTPAGPAKAAKPPLIVMPHGGPEARDMYTFEPWAQAFATRGYVVFQPNFRGSGGFGVEFAEKGYGQWGLRMQDDVLDGVKDLIAKGLVDPDRICIVGASYGGYVALQAGAKNPELFKCVISRAGVADLTAMMKYEKAMFDDGPRYQYWRTAIGDPVKDAERLKATSPITYAKTYVPPVLLLHGDWDWTVPMEQSLLMEKALKTAGKQVELVKYEGEEHGGWSTENDVDGLDRMIAFVEKAIGAKPQPAAK